MLQLTEHVGLDIEERLIVISSFITFDEVHRAYNIMRKKFLKKEYMKIPIPFYDVLSGPQFIHPTNGWNVSWGDFK